ncbi:hypothetical protein KI387_013876, partial [Taxus chinensis]
MCPQHSGPLCVRWDSAECSGIGAVDRDHSLMVALIERWDPATNVFHLPTREMTITLEDVYHILRLPLVGEVVFQVDAETAMDSILQ